MAALRYYQRALVFAPSFEDAIERITLIALLTKNAPVLQIALDRTRAAQLHNPQNGVFAFDHGLIAMRTSHVHEARDAFERAGALRHDWQGYAFATFLDRRIHDSTFARLDWKLVKQLNPAFVRFHSASHAQ